MVGGISRRFFLGTAVSAIAGLASSEGVSLARAAGLRPLSPDPTDPVREVAVTQKAATAVADMLARAKLGGQVGFIVADARTGLILEGHHADVPLPPASVAKAVTATYALSSLGSDYRFSTRLVATGPVQNGRLNGDLLLVGSGDPMLDTDALAGLAQKLKAVGVREITGGFKVYAGALPYVREIDPGQPDHVGYNPAVSGLNLNFNRVHFQWQQSGNGWAVSMDARSDKVRPAVSVAKMAVVNRDLPVYTYKNARGIDEWTVASTALGKGGSRWLPVRRPDLYAGEVLQVLAKAQGIKLPPPVATGTVSGGTVLATHESPTLSTITRLMMKYSTNLTAEVLGLSASKAQGQSASSLRASAKAMSSWMKSGFGAKSISFDDHSGLGDGSRISSADLVRLLVKVGAGKTLHTHMKEIQPWDAGGKVDPDARHKIHAKTGTLNFVSTLAGYVTTPDGTPLAFAILTADTKRRSRLSPEEMERPEGGSEWKARSRWLQHQLINRWVALYGG